jgi:hypothetical protein
MFRPNLHAPPPPTLQGEIKVIKGSVEISRASMHVLLIQRSWRPWSTLTNEDTRFIRLDLMRTLDAGVRGRGYTHRADALFIGRVNCYHHRAVDGHCYAQSTASAATHFDSLGPPSVCWQAKYEPRACVPRWPADRTRKARVMAIDTSSVSSPSGQRTTKGFAFTFMFRLFCFLLIRGSIFGLRRGTMGELAADAFISLFARGSELSHATLLALAMLAVPPLPTHVGKPVGRHSRSGCWRRHCGR